MSLQVAAHEAVLTGAHFQRGGAGIVDAGGSVVLGRGQHAFNTAPRGLAVLTVHAAAERADLLTGEVGAAQQFLRAQRCVLGAVLVLDAMTAARRAPVL